MLFDLRSRGRRRTVQAVYLGLAILMGGGLVLFGVGAGNGVGGLLNGLGGGGSNSGQQSAISQAEKSAIKATQLNPSSSSAWSNLIQARWSAASNSANASTNQFTAAGKNELTQLGSDYQRYKQLVKQPDPTVAILAARAYQYLGNYSAATATWADITAAEPTTATAFECEAANAYAANNTRTGDLASNKALSLVPSAQRTLLKSRINQAKTDPTVAQSC
jgi:hypothetical protein